MLTLPYLWLFMKDTYILSTDEEINNMQYVPPMDCYLVI